MSKILMDYAVVLRTFDYGESSIIAVLLTRKNGKIRVLAKGAKRKKSGVSSSFMTGNICEIVFYSSLGRGLQILKEISCSSSFDSVGKELKRLSLFQAALEIVDRSVIELETDEGVFDLVENFSAILPLVADPWAAFFTFEVKLLKITGFFPSLTVLKCEKCGMDLAGKEFGINTLTWYARCEKCVTEGMVLISASASSILKDMESKSMNNIIELRLDRKKRREIGRFLHEIFLVHVDRYELPSSLGLLKGVN
jgi:DNA repair protein RecO (recombination protein O)